MNRVFDEANNRLNVFPIVKDEVLFINESTHGNVTVGLVINQGANDDAILAFKSSDINHGLTTSFGNIETDDFFVVKKTSGTVGGVNMTAIGDNASQGVLMQLSAIGGTFDTGKATSDRAKTEIGAYEHNGSNGVDNTTADGNVFAVRTRRGGAYVSLILVDEDGDFYSTTSAQTFDDYDDSEIIELYDKVRSYTPKDIVDEEWKALLREQEQQLIDIGVLGAPVVGVSPDKQGMTNVTQLVRVLTGNARQEHHRLVALEEKLALAESKLAAIGA